MLTDMDDELEDGAQPRCVNCGTVMHMIDGSYACRGCGRTVGIPWVDRPTGADDLPGAWD